MQAVVETNRDPMSNFLLDEVLNFCLYSSACKSLNLSFLDFLRMDYATFKHIKTFVEKRDTKVEKEHKEILDRQDKLAEEIKDATRKSAQ